MKRILAFLLDLEFTETCDGVVLPPNDWQDQALLDLGRLFKDPEPEAKARALARVEGAERQWSRLTENGNASAN